MIYGVPLSIYGTTASPEPDIPQFVLDVKAASVGDMVVVDNMDWILVNKTTIAGTLGLKYWYTDTVFGSNTTYKGSTIANLAATFENGLTTETKQWLNSVTVNNVTAKVFIPSKDQLNGGFSYYATTNNRIFKNSGGTAKGWWTSSALDSSYVWGVLAGGDANFGSPSTSFGFRPHIEVNIAD